jgi:hypothetical protein
MPRIVEFELLKENHFSDKNSKIFLDDLTISLGLKQEGSFRMLSEMVS